MVRNARAQFPAVPCSLERCIWNDMTEPIASDNSLGSPRIEEVKVTDSTPGSPNGQIRARAGLLVRLRADPRREYVSAGQFNWYSAYVRTLPFHIDDVTADFGDDIYDRMLKDGQVLAAVNALKTAVLQSGVDLLAADVATAGTGVASSEANEGDPDLKNLAEEIRAFCKRVLDDLDTPLEDVLWDMLDAVAYGNKVAELVYKVVNRTGVSDRTDARLGSVERSEAAQQETSKPYLELRAIKVKPRKSIAFLVDSFSNVIGLLGTIPGQGAPVYSGAALSGQSAKNIPNLIPRSKFAVLTFRPKDGDPRGTSILRAAYNPWWIKQQIWPEYLKYLAQFATPSLIGITSPDAQDQPKFDEAGNEIPDAFVTPEEAMVGSLMKIRNGSVAAFPHGSDVKPISAVGEGGAFISAIDMLDRQISKGILHQTLTIDEGQHMARAAAEVHEHVLIVIIKQLRLAVKRMIRRDILIPLVRYNYGESLVPLTPQVSMGDVDRQDFGSIAAAIGGLFSSQYLDPTHLQQTDTMLGLRARPQEAIDAIIAQRAQGQQAQAAQAALSTSIAKANVAKLQQMGVDSVVQEGGVERELEAMAAEERRKAKEQSEEAVVPA